MDNLEHYARLVHEERLRSHREVPTLVRDEEGNEGIEWRQLSDDDAADLFDLRTWEELTDAEREDIRAEVREWWQG